MNLSPLTEKDKEDLDFVVHHADAIGYSFVKSAADEALLQKELKKRCGKSFHHLALVAKIENKEVVENLPDIIVQAVTVLTNILQRMEQHQYKKTSQLGARLHGMQEVRSSILLISTIKNTITTRFTSRVVIFFVCVHLRSWVYEKENMG